MAKGALDVSQAVLADVFGVTAFTIRKWNPPRNKDGSYNVGDVVRWRIERLKEEIADALEGGRETDELKRWRAARAALAEEELARRRNEVVPIADVTRQWADAITQARSVLLALPNALAPQLENRAAAEICNKLTDAIHGALNALGKEPDVTA